jgi:hypothetical protein
LIKFHDDWAIRPIFYNYKCIKAAKRRPRTQTEGSGHHFSTIDVPVQNWLTASGEK